MTKLPERYLLSQKLFEGVGTWIDIGGEITYIYIENWHNEIQTIISSVQVHTADIHQAFLST